MEQLKILSPAKINLHLQITSKRKDGYHNLISLFQMVSLYDEISIKIIKNDEILLNGNFDCPMEDNLIYKAIVWLRKRHNIKSGFRINCIKNIPQGAGLGGGSSNAAAILTGVNSLLNLGNSKEDLKVGALELGSDIPFFLEGPTSIAEGRGEILTNLPTREDLYLLISDTGFHSSTREIFNLLNIEENNNKSLSLGDITDSYLKSDPSLWPFFNSFTPYLYKKYPIYEEIINLFNKNGSVYSSITGTGSSVFGVFRDVSRADGAQKVLKNSNIITHKVKMLANRPEPVYNYPTA